MSSMKNIPGTSLPSSPACSSFIPEKRKKIKIWLVPGNFYVSDNSSLVGH